MKYLVDTNVISEVRKKDRMDANVRAWFDQVDDTDIFLSVLVIGELRKGIERIRRRDFESAARLDIWLVHLCRIHQQRILPITSDIADRWGKLGIPDPVPAIDGLLAATAIVHGLTLVTRNERDVISTGALVLNPFQAGEPR